MKELDRKRWKQREEQSPAGCGQRRNVSPPISSVSWSTSHCKQEMWMFVGHLQNHSRLCNPFILPGKRPLGKLGTLPFAPFQLSTPGLGPTSGSFGLWFTKWSVKGLDYGLKFPGIFQSVQNTFCLQHLRPVHIFFFLPAGYKVVWLLQCVCIQGLSSLDCFYMFIMKVTAP